MTKESGGHMNSWIGRFAVHLLLLSMAFFMFLPFYWMISTSFKTYADSVQIPPSGSQPSLISRGISKYLKKLRSALI